MGAEFHIYRDDDGELRWTLVHENGETIADSGEGYTAEHNLLNGIESVKQNAADAPIVDNR